MDLISYELRLALTLKGCRRVASGESANPFYERSCQEQTSPCLAANKFLTASPDRFAAPAHVDAVSTPTRFAVPTRQYQISRPNSGMVAELDAGLGLLPTAMLDLLLASCRLIAAIVSLRS